MFEVFKRPRHTAKIDLASVRDTLLYIDSDLGQAPQLHRLRSAVQSALQEIERLQPTEAEIAEPKFAAAQFLPVRL